MAKKCYAETNITTQLISPSPYCSLNHPWCFSVGDSKGYDQMDEREELLPSLVAAHEWIEGQDNLCWAPCR